MTATFNARIQFELAYHTLAQTLAVLFELNQGSEWNDYLEVFERYEWMLAAYANGEPIPEDLELEADAREYKQVLRMNIVNMHWRDFMLRANFPNAMGEDRNKEHRLTMEITRRFLALPKWKVDTNIHPQNENHAWDLALAWRVHLDLRLPGSGEWVVASHRAMTEATLKGEKDEHERAPKSPSLMYPRGRATARAL